MENPQESLASMNGVMNNLQLHDGSYNTLCERGGEAVERTTFHKILTEISCSKEAQYPEKIFFFIYDLREMQ